MKNTATPQVTTTPDFRSELQHLFEAFTTTTWRQDEFSAALDRARAALDEPVAKDPTVMELVELSTEIEEQGLGQIDFARAVLARWGQR